MPDPIVSIIVPTYGRTEGLKKLFDSLRGSAPSDAYELVIVSSDPPETEKAAWLRQQPDARVVFADARKSWQLRRKSNYYYLNLAIKNSRAPWIFPISDDMYFEPHWYGEFLTVINDPANANAGLIIAASHVGNLQSGIRVAVIGKTKKSDGPWRGLYLSDVSMVRRDIMESIGMFDENMDWFGSGADLSLAVEFLTDTDTVVAENIRVSHTLTKEHRSTNMGNAFRDFHYLLRKWNQWCAAHDCQYVWDPRIPPYTLSNRIKNYLAHRKKILRHHVKYFLRRNK